MSRKLKIIKMERRMPLEKGCKLWMTNADNIRFSGKITRCELVLLIDGAQKIYPPEP